MKSLLVELSPSNKGGFANQMYIIANAVSYATKNNINTLFLTPFLKQINTNQYTNISDIIDLQKTNKYLKYKYNLQLADINKAIFKVVNITYGHPSLNVSILHFITKSFVKNSILHIPKEFSFKDFNDMINTAIPNLSNIRKLWITYELDNIESIHSYDINNDYLENDIVYDFHNMKPVQFPVICDMTPVFYDTKEHLIFNNNFIESTNLFIKLNNIDTSKVINFIHLRLEDDAIEHWSKESNMLSDTFKKLVENKYISAIKENIKKDDLTIILSYNYNNMVMNFLNDNKYNILTTPSWSDYRDISAIYDLNLGQICNNIYIGVYESTFSYLLLYRMPYKKKFIRINYLDY